MATWNRKTRRQMSRYGIGQKQMEIEFDATWKRAEEAASRFAFAGMIKALVDKFGFPKEQLHDLAVETMRNINGATCASALVDMVKADTGFDVDEPLDEFEVNGDLMDLEEIE